MSKEEKIERVNVTFKMENTYFVITSDPLISPGLWVDVYLDGEKMKTPVWLP